MSINTITAEQIDALPAAERTALAERVRIALVHAQSRLGSVSYDLELAAGETGDDYNDHASAAAGLKERAAGYGWAVKGDVSVESIALALDRLGELTSAAEEYEACLPAGLREAAQSRAWPSMAVEI